MNPRQALVLPLLCQALLTQICPILESHFGHPALASEVVVGHVGNPEGGLNRGEGLPEFHYCERLLKLIKKRHY